MGVYHRVAGGYYGSTSSFNQNLGHPGDEAGWAAGAGFVLKDVLGMKGDTFGVQGQFTEGAMGYLTANGLGALEGFSGGANGFGNSIGFSSVTDGIFTTGSSIELTTGWTVAGVYEHHWTPEWKTSVWGGYVTVTYDDTAAQMYCGYSSSSPRGSASTSSGGLGAIVSSCDPNTSFWNAGTRTQWNPNSNLDLGVDFMWNHLDTANSGIASLPAQGARPGTSGGSLAAPNSTWYNISNYDVYTVAVRAQYNFLP